MPKQHYIHMFLIVLIWTFALQILGYAFTESYLGIIFMGGLSILIIPFILAKWRERISLYLRSLNELGTMHLILFIIQSLLLIIGLMLVSTLKEIIHPIMIASVTLILMLLIESIRWTSLLPYARMASTLELLAKERVQMNEAFLTIRAQRHDFLTHAGAIHYLMEQEQWQKARDYLRQLVDEYNRVNFSVRGEQGHVAALLYQIYQQARQRNIRIQYDLEVPFSTAPLSPVHQSELLGNLLMNALEAATAYGKVYDDPFITVHTAVRSGLFILEVTNATLPLPPEILDTLFESYGNSTKEGKHEGMGTYIIAKITANHQGKLEFTCLNNTFHVKIKIPIVV